MPEHLGEVHNRKDAHGEEGRDVLCSAQAEAETDGRKCDDEKGKQRRLEGIPIPNFEVCTGIGALSKVQLQWE